MAIFKRVFMREAFLFFILHLFIYPVSAQDIDPLWTKAQTVMQLNKALVAADIYSVFVLDGDSERVDGKYKTVISGWENGEPVRTLSEQTESSKKSFKLNKSDMHIATSLANHPADFFQSANTVVRLEDKSLQGKLWAVMQISSSGAKGGGPYRAMVWLDPATGNPLKADVILEKILMHGVKTAHFLLLFDSDKEGRVLPKEIWLDYEMVILFRKAKMSFKQTISAWKPRQ